MGPTEPNADDAVPGAMRWSVEARLRFIDAQAFWEGRINRSDVMATFGVSTPQAAADLKRYLALAPANLAYDPRGRTYRATASFRPAFGTPDAEAWLRRGLEEGGAPLEIASLPLPARAIDAEALRIVAAAARAGARLGLLYQSMGRSEPSFREVTPRAVATDGLRWHLRAFCHSDQRWEDFLFPRMVAIDMAGPEQLELPPDRDWERLVDVRLRPASRLGPAQAAAVARDYAMAPGSAAPKAGSGGLSGEATLEAPIATGPVTASPVAVAPAPAAFPSTPLASAAPLSAAPEPLGSASTGSAPAGSDPLDAASVAAASDEGAAWAPGKSPGEQLTPGRDPSSAAESAGPERRIAVRAALLPYLIRRLRLDVGDSLVEIANATELADLLPWRGSGTPPAPPS